MQFQLTSISDQIGEQTILAIYMSVNGVTFSCANNIDSFKDAKSAKVTLTAVISQLIANCYSSNKLDELKEELKALDEKREQLKHIIKQYE